MKRSHTAALAAAFLTLPAVTLGAHAASSTDATFAMKFSQSGADEISLAQQALKKSSNPTVVAFAKKMIADHTKAGAKLASIAEPEGDSTPMHPDAAGKMMASKLMASSTFDATYRSENITGHQTALALLQQEISSGTDAKLVSYAKMTLPTVQMHLKMAQALPTT